MKKYFLLVVLIFLIFGCTQKSYKIQKKEAHQLIIDNKIDADSTFYKYVNPYRDSLKSKMNRILSYTLTDLDRKKGKLESNLGNLYADMCFDYIQPLLKKQDGANLDISLFNYGGIRSMIPKGMIRVKDIFNLMPFENKFVVVKISGGKMQELLNFLLKEHKAHPISHTKLVIRNNKMTKVFINGKKFDTNRNYYILTSDFLQHGGDNMTFLKNPLQLYNFNIKVRDALIQSFDKMDTINAGLDNRFIEK